MSLDTILKGHDLFNLLPVEQAHRLSNISSVKHYAAGETIFKVNGPATHVFMLLKGDVSLRLPANPPEFSLVISRLERGELFGLSPLLEATKYTTTARCSSDAEVLVFEAAALLSLLSDSSQVGYTIMRKVARIYYVRYESVLNHLHGMLSQIALVR